MIRLIYIVPVILVMVEAASIAGPWIPLFDGVSLNGWETTDGQPVPQGAWRAEKGTLHLDAGRGRGGNIVTDRLYGDFELVFEWTIARGSNNGIKYRVHNFDGQVLGCEYQIIDDVDHGYLPPKQRTSSLYDLYPVRSHNALKPPGEFNRGAIIVQGDRIEHWLNGRLVVTATVGDTEWNERIAQSKFSDVEGFGRNHFGRIMLTDHGDEIWYRNVFLRPLGNDQWTRPRVPCRPQRVTLLRSRRTCLRVFR